MERIAIIEAHSGKIIREEKLEGDLEETVKKVATQLLEEKWMPSFSDFMVLRDVNDIRLSLPLSKEEVDFYKKYELKRIDSNTAQAMLPLFLIVYESLKISEEDYHNRGIAAVSVYFREDELEQIREMLTEVTKKPSLEELESKMKVASELLEEAEEEVSEKPKRGRRKRK